MYRCTNEDCRQALYIQMSKDTDIISLAGECFHLGSAGAEEAICPVCGNEDTLDNFKTCFEDPLPFTFLEKEELCMCGGEIIQNVNMHTALKLANTKGLVQDAKPPLVCEDCGAPAGKVFLPEDVPSIEAIKKYRNL